MKLTTRTQEVEDAGKRKFVALDVVASHNGKAVIWRWNNVKDASLVHLIIDKTNKMIEVLQKTNPELIDKAPKKTSKKESVKKAVKVMSSAAVVKIETDIPKAIKKPGSTRID